VHRKYAHPSEAHRTCGVMWCAAHVVSCDVQHMWCAVHVVCSACGVQCMWCAAHVVCRVQKGVGSVVLCKCEYEQASRKLVPHTSWFHIQAGSTYKLVPRTSWFHIQAGSTYKLVPHTRSWSCRYLLVSYGHDGPAQLHSSESCVWLKHLAVGCQM
jgi:hypothetical protein